ncbi:MAG: SPOR domain-containing protein [Balneolaceae bacterium]
MKIDKQELIELLIVKTGLDQKSIEKQLDELVGKIRDAADRGKALEVKGFGLFYYSEEGELKFDPSEEFKTEVNFKYTGLEPIEVQEGRIEDDIEEILSEEEPDTDISEEVEDADIWGFDHGDLGVDDTETDQKPEDQDERSVTEESPEPEKKDDLDEEILKKEQAEASKQKKKDSEKEKEKPGKKTETEDKDSEDEKDERFDELIGGAFSAMEKEPEEEKSDPEDPVKSDKDLQSPVADVNKTLNNGEKKDKTAEKKVSKKEQEEDLKVPAAAFNEKEKKAETKAGLKIPETARKTAATKKSYKVPVQEKQSIPINAIIIGLSVLIVIIVGYFVVSDLTSHQAAIQPSPTVVQAPEPVVPDETQEQTETAADPEDETAAETVQEQEAVDSEPAATEEPSAEEAEPLYGLMGTVNETINNGYTIIVHSLSNENNARNAMEDFKNDGYRAMIFSRSVPEAGTVWRVGLGQFETLENAQNAANELPSPYNENNFIHRIQ